MNIFAGLFSRRGWQEALKRPSARVLIGVNLSLIAGVVVWDWSVFDIVFLYWVENLVVGLINVLRMAIASPKKSSMPLNLEKIQKMERGSANKSMAGMAAMSHGIKFILIPFFIVHYGGCCYVHGMFVMAMFGDDGMMGLNSASSGSFSLRELFTPTMILAISLLAASHIFSFFKNYLIGGEYRRSHAAMLMSRPYGRIVALHITIIFGAILSTIFGSPLALLIVLVVMKTGADLALHQLERQKLGSSTSAE